MCIRDRYKSNRILISSLRQKLQLIGINADKLSESNISKSVSVHSPIDGFVSAVDVNIGKYVTPVSYTHLDVYKRQVVYRCLYINWQMWQ